MNILRTIYTQLASLKSGAYYTIWSLADPIGRYPIIQFDARVFECSVVRRHTCATVSFGGILCRHGTL